MTVVNWETFETLPGSVGSNFEKLCRALIRRHYGRYGELMALASQPGVEFHLKLHTKCSLGDPGQWYGWQCRWYDLPAARALGTTRRNKILKAINTTEKELPGLTDWILWTRYPLTAGDQRWFYGIKTRMRMHLWTASEVEEHLSGEAEIFRGTYFGELVLGPETLENLHKQAVAPIRQRWRPEVHQPVDAERVIRAMLGESGTWDHFLAIAARLAAETSAVEADANDLTGRLADSAKEMPRIGSALVGALSDAHSLLTQGDLDFLAQHLRHLPSGPSGGIAALPRQLRAIRNKTALRLTNALATARRAHELLEQMEFELGERLIAVLAEAGCGKTQLSAQLTAATADRPSGILLYGRDLHAGQNLDHLASRVVIQGTPVPSMEALVASVDAAGRRAVRRLPIVIDGLNEAEDPRDWKGLLASLDERLCAYPYVLVVVTLRPAFGDEVLPPDTRRLETSGFAHDTGLAIRRYFEHYKIDRADADLPLELLQHPLTLRLFCEVTNPDRKRIVGIEAMPRTLAGLFDRYVNQVAGRVAELAPRTRRYYEMDVHAALDEIGWALWTDRLRSMDLGALRKRLRDETRPWDESIVRALEQDGVLLRLPGGATGASEIGVVYDALAGHLAASAVLSRHGSSELERWINDAENLAKLVGPLPERHPLAEDTFRALVALVPRRQHRQQLWHLLEEPLRTSALLQAADLEAEYLDARTVDELASLVLEPPDTIHDLLDRLRRTRGSTRHPLNAEFLNRVLGPISVAQRDLRWTEWVRRQSNVVLGDLRRFARRWRETGERSGADRLRARWIMWTLTSTSRELRDEATCALYWFGRGEPAALFGLSLEAVAINDPYVPERLLAASYGVAMAHQRPDAEFSRVFRTFLAGLRDTLTLPTATHPTNHWLTRLYVQGMVSLATAYHKDAIPEGMENQGRVVFAPGPALEPLMEGDSRAAEVNSTIQMDFENYTLGRLFDNRRNYDMSHAGHQAAVAHVLGTIWDLGWRRAELGEVDEWLTRGRSHIERSQVERYGKKYGWIGFFTYAGILADQGKLPLEKRLSDVDIDPSFPPLPPLDLITGPVWVHPAPPDDLLWIREGVVTIQDELLYRARIGDHEGPWIAVYGSLETEDQTPGRRVWGVLRALLVAAHEADLLIEILERRDHPGGWWLPQAPSDIYTFAGEIPWHPDFARSEASDHPTHLYLEELTDEDDVTGVDVEILAHYYGWENYHSPLNEAGGSLVPSKLFSAALDLRGIPQSFNQTLPDGTLAAVSLRAPAGFRGDLLYLREDLVHQYASGRQLVWFAWGERQLVPFPDPAPEWLVQARNENMDVWRHVRMGRDVSATFGSKRKPV